MRRLAYAKRLCWALREALPQRSAQAHIDRNGLARLLTYKRFTDWLNDAGLNIEDTTRLFKALDMGDGLVALDEFLAAISQICNSATNRDVILHQESAMILNVVQHMQTALQASK